jgi:hypothetical protein
MRFILYLLAFLLVIGTILEKNNSLLIGIEPMTLRLTAARSNQLSYRSTTTRLILSLLYIGIEPMTAALLARCSTY